MNPRRHAPQPRDESPAREPSEVVFGLRAGLAVFARRRDDITRVAYDADARAELGELLRWCASRKILCEELPPPRLDRVADSSHHEGLCVTAHARKWTPAASLGELLTQRRGVAVALDRVRNPYNIGAILRSAAFFGVDAALLGSPAPHPALPPDAVRVAEGGVEHLACARTTDLADTLARLRSKGIRVIGADGASKVSVVGYGFERPAVLVLGHEREGMSDRVRAQCDAIVAIPGSGAVESLNVAVAAGVMISELVRARPAQRV